MTKVINKKALLVLLTLVLAFCWLAVPVSAAEVNDNADYFVEEAGEISFTPLDGMGQRSITSNLLKQLDVYAAKKNSDGTYTTYTIGGSPLTETGPANILNCYLPDGYYQAMLNEGLGYFYCELTFTVRGSNLKQYKLVVNDEVKYTGSLASSGGTYTVYWVSPRQETTTFDIIAYDSNNTSSAAWGHIYR